MVKVLSMRCEICGKKIIGRPIRTKVDGSVMQTCQDCSKFGKVQREPQRTTKPRTLPRSPRYQEPSYEVLEDFKTVVREAREKKGWSREDLGEKVYEKVSVINRIESGRMIPDLKLARKLEKTLKVKLLEKVELEKQEDSGQHSIKGATIGDIARIKRN
jgi:putative transcription factor